jgi:4-amino-4-deoxy-L-arabinose transferase-like glycosyltransferase
MHMRTRESGQGQAILGRSGEGAPDRTLPEDRKPMMPGFVAGEATYLTRRRQIAVAAATGVLALLLAIGPLFGDADRVVYTNNIPARVLATAANPGDRMCRRLVQIPKGATAVQLTPLTYGRPGPPLDLVVRTPGASLRSHVDGGYPDLKWASFRFAPPGRTALATICVTNAGTRRVAFAGVGYDTSRFSPLTVNRTPQRGDLAVQVLGKRQSLLGLAPTIFKRAAVWGPTFIGSWTYYLLFAFGLAMLAVAVWLVLVGREPRRFPRLNLPRAVLLIAAIAAINGVGWSLLIPAWQAPDEIAHFAYVQHFAETGKPSADTNPRVARDYSTEHQYAMESALTNTVRANPKGKPPWDESARRAWKARDDRLDPARGDGNRAALSYTPAYYGTAALGYLAFDWGDIFDRLFGTRLISALLGGLTAIWTWLFARELFRREDWLPNTAALSVVLLPQFGFMSGVVNNDNLVIMLGSLELYLLARFLRRGPGLRLSALIGVVLALGYLAKPSMAAFGPVVAGVLAWPLLRDRDRRQLLVPAAGLAGFVAIALLWSGVAAVSGRGVSTVTTAGTRTFALGDFASYVWHFYLPSLPGTTDKWFGSQAPVYSVWIHSFFAAFGSNDTLFHESVYKAIRAACVIVALLIGVAAWRERAAVRRALPVVLMSLVAAVSLIGFIHLTFYLYYNGYPGEQGRYLLPLAPLFGAAVAASTLALGRRLAPLLATFYVTGLGCFTLFSYGLVLTRYFA